MKTVITTHPVNSSTSFINILSESDILAYHLPMIQIEYNPPTEENASIINSLMDFNLLIFTSKNGVQGFFRLLENITEGFQLHEHIKIAAIGETTASEMKNFNHTADYINFGTTTDQFSDYLKSNVITAKSKILLANGNLSPYNLQSKLNEICFTKRIEVYKTRKPDNIDADILSIAKKQETDMLIFNSPSAFRNFIELTGITAVELRTEIASIGSATGSYITSKGFPVNLVATIPHSEHFAQEIITYLNKTN